MNGSTAVDFYDLYLKRLLGAQVSVQIDNGVLLTGMLSAIEDYPGAYQIEATQGNRVTATMFHVENVTAIQLPDGQRADKRKGPK